MSLAYSHVDVFSRIPFGGNSLPVFPDAGDLSAEQMLRITQELRHFEAIFLRPTDQPDTVEARIFDLFDELPFAGHPIIGAAAVLHKHSGAAGAQSWRFQLVGQDSRNHDRGHRRRLFGLAEPGRPGVLGDIR